MCIPDHIDNVTASSWQATATGVNEKQVPTLGQSLVAGWLYDTNIESKNLVNSSGIQIWLREQREQHSEGTLRCNFMLVTFSSFYA